MMDTLVKKDLLEKGSTRLNAILIVEDDPLHLKLYTWIVERGGFPALPVLVEGRTVELPREPFKIALLDYRLGLAQAPRIAAQIRDHAPDSHLIVLSDSMWLPEEMRPFTDRFVRKGEPEELLKLLSSLTG